MNVKVYMQRLSSTRYTVVLQETDLSANCKFVDAVAEIELLIQRQKVDLLLFTTVVLFDKSSC
jgi:hypothetical protein